jgi:hypothetical protein
MENGHEPDGSCPFQRINEDGERKALELERTELKAEVPGKTAEFGVAGERPLDPERVGRRADACDVSVRGARRDPEE